MNDSMSSEISLGQAIFIEVTLPTDRAFARLGLRALLQRNRAVYAETHVPAGHDDRVDLLGEADDAFLVGVSDPGDPGRTNPEKRLLGKVVAILVGEVRLINAVDLAYFVSLALQLQKAVVKVSKREFKPTSSFCRKNRILISFFSI